jgi:hypothetical protein
MHPYSTTAAYVMECKKKQTTDKCEKRFCFGMDCWLVQSCFRATVTTTTHAVRGWMCACVVRQRNEMRHLRNLQKVAALASAPAPDVDLAVAGAPSPAIGQA